MSTPINWAGYQLASNGVGYAGCLTYLGTVPNTREFIAQNLTTPLNIGTKYFISFQVNLSLGFSTDANCASDKIGATFAMAPYCCSSFIKNSAAVFKNSLITDSTNWTKVFGSFTADSAYSYIVLGNFFSDANTNIQKFYNTFSDQSYYYIDDICVSTDSSHAYNFATSVESHLQTENTLKAFPNPASELLTVSGKGASTLRLFTKQGQCILTNYFFNSTSIDVRNLADDLYFVQIVSGAMTFYDKIIVRH